MPVFALSQKKRFYEKFMASLFFCKYHLINKFLLLLFKNHNLCIVMLATIQKWYMREYVYVVNISQMTF